MKRSKYKFLSALLAGLALCTTSLRGSAAEPIAVQMASDFALSPTGETLVFRWANELWSVGIEGGTAKRLTNHPAVDSEPKFSPDGKQLAFISNRNGSNQIYVMPAEGGIPEQKTFHSEGYSLGDWFPDGNSILATGSRDHYWRAQSRLMQIDLTKRSAEKILLDDTALAPSLSRDGKKFSSFAKVNAGGEKVTRVNGPRKSGCSTLKRVKQPN